MRSEAVIGSSEAWREYQTRHLHPNQSGTSHMRLQTRRQMVLPTVDRNDVQAEPFFVTLVNEGYDYIAEGRYKTVG